MKVSVAPSVPPVVGLKVTVSVQFAAAASVAPEQLSAVLVNIAAFGPETLTLEMPRLVLPEFVAVTTTESAPPIGSPVKLRLPVDGVAAGWAPVNPVAERLNSGPEPVPFKVTVCGLSGAFP